MKIGACFQNSNGYWNKLMPSVKGRGEVDERYYTCGR